MSTIFMFQLQVLDKIQFIYFKPNLIVFLNFCLYYSYFRIKAIPPIGSYQFNSILFYVE
jgi:hypothetical protein